MNRAPGRNFRVDLLAERSACASADYPFPVILPGNSGAGVGTAWESGPYVKEEEFARTVSLGLFDYLRKSRSRGFVVSISGGVDSATVTILSALLVQLGSRELGLQGFLEGPYIPGWDDVGGAASGHSAAAELCLPGNPEQFGNDLGSGACRGRSRGCRVLWVRGR